MFPVSSRIRACRTACTFTWKQSRHARISALAAFAMLSLSGCVTGSVGDATRGALASAMEGYELPGLGPSTGSLAQVGMPLTQVAAGRIEGPRPPDLVREALMEIAADYGPGLAGRLAATMLTGGIGGVTAIPAFASGASDAVKTLEAAAEAQSAIDAAYAANDSTRSETALVPDRDRPAEAAALMRIVDAQSGTAGEWVNPDTGASGSVVIGDYDKGETGYPCRMVAREYRIAGTAREGKGLLCREGGAWYDLG